MTKFTIQDFTSGSQVDTEIEEPIDWTAISINMRRDQDAHGMFDVLATAFTNFKYYGQAATILKTAFENHGIDARVKLKIEFACEDGGTLETLYAGNFGFRSYNEEFGIDGFYVNCYVATEDYQMFKDGKTQKVCLDSLQKHDQGLSPLPPYDALSRDVKLPGKTIILEDKAKYRALPITRTTSPHFFLDEDRQNNEILVNALNLSGNTHSTLTPYALIEYEELKDFPGGVGELQDGTPTSITDADHVFQFVPENNYIDTTVSIDINFNLLFAPLIPYTSGGDFVPHGKLEVFVMKGIDYATAKASSPLHTHVLVDRDYNPVGNTVGGLDCDTLNFNWQGTASFSPNEKLYVLISCEHFNNGSSGHGDSMAFYLVFISGSYQTRTFGADRVTSGPDPTIDQNFIALPGKTVPQDSYIRLTLDSKVDATTGKSYMIYESLARAAEIITDGEMTVVSDYYGRTDSQPYAYSADGGGSLLSITNGLNIRGFTPIQLQMSGYSSALVNSQTADYTLNFTTDTGNIVEINATAPHTVTIPTNTASAFTIGAQVIVRQANSGPVSIVASAGVSVNCPGGIYRTTGQGSMILLTKIDTDNWLLATHAPMFESFSNMMQSLQAIHSIGWGTEVDPNDSSHNCIRVEPVHYFYQDAVMMECDAVDSIKMAVVENNVIRTINVGYQKWEAEGAGGLDDFHSKRQYRTTLSKIQTSIDKLSRFVASGYAIELTRRIGLVAGTKDWRYDNDTFALCMKRDTGSVVSPYAVLIGDAVSGIAFTSGTSFSSIPIVTMNGGGGSGATAYVTALDSYGNIISIVVDNGGSGYTTPPIVTITPGSIIEQGDITGAHNIIDPDTVYNWRISPERNLLRWLWMALQSYSAADDQSLIFTEGQGNYYAYGLQVTDPVEAHAISESQKVSTVDLADVSNGPIYKPYTHSFTYPMSYAQWQAVYAAKYGTIKYRVAGGDWLFGYIEELKYSPYNGTAEFILKPKY